MAETLVAGPELDARVCRALGIPKFVVTPQTTTGERLESIDFGYPRVSRSTEFAWTAVKALLTIEGAQWVNVCESNPPIGCQAFYVPTVGALLKSARYPTIALAICDLALQVAEKLHREALRRGAQSRPLRGDAPPIDEEAPPTRRSAAESRLSEARLDRVREQLGRGD
jgi:hypothetical protein